ncbi:MAG TPA: BTAD domain-containing putative transcriptional regulator [Anaerolineales bacterium]|nr:BTAD domain-containing putative transcriptional regulator [Anaerolineales bacterium]
MIKFYLLGAFQVLADGQPLTGFVSNKVRALLAYLAVESERPHSREALTGLLWPDWPQASAQGNLRYALSNLRKLLRSTGIDILSVTRQSVKFNCTDQVWADVALFQKLLGNGQMETPNLQSLEEAASLYRGEFLDGLTVSDNAAFEEWRTVRREQFHRQALELLHVMADVYIELGEYDQSLKHAWRQLELEPWNEEAHQQVMRALALSGQREAALTQYERCCQLLMRELDIEPLPETTKLFAEIRDGKLTRAGGKKSYEKTRLSNLPHPLTSFVGREREVAEIERLIAGIPTSDSNLPVRLLTLVGAGGCGKTRLAIESAGHLTTADGFPNGLWWIDLARLNDPMLIVQAITEVLRLRETPDAPLITSLTNYLRNKEMLLLLDNCEHLIDSCAQIAETLLLACPKLQILATSREALDIDGERIFQVNPLSLPDPANPPSLKELLNYEAVRLFIDRAEAVSLDLLLTRENASAIIQICRQLDGIPLAIELAARQLKSLPLEQIAARLENRFLLLINGGRTALPYHRTLRGMLDWSYDFLAKQERWFFQQLSIFSGGWTLESAERITEGNTLELLTVLVNKSLAIVEQTGRYRMLETICQYGREKLIGADQEESVRSRHLNYFVQFAERSRKELQGRDQKFWMDQVQAEHDNIRSALEWSLRSVERSEVGLRLAVAMSEFWNRCGYYREERRWLERALALTDETCPPRLRAWANIKLGYCAFCLGDFATLQTCLDFAWEIFSRLEDTEGIALVLQGRAALAVEQRYDLEPACTYLEESLQLLRSINEKWELAETLRDLGYVFYLRREPKNAKAYLNEALLLCCETSNTFQLGQTLYQLGRVACQEGDYPSARSYFEESRQLAKEVRDRGGDMDVLSALGELARSEGNFQQAQIFYEEGLLMARELGAEYGIAVFLQGLGYVSLHYGDYPRATELLNEGLQYWQKQNMHQRIAGNLAGLAGVAVALGEMEKAAQLLGKVDALMKERGSYLLPPNQLEYEHSVAAARKHLGEERYRVIQLETDDMTLEQVIQLTLCNHWNRLAPHR